jgi:hypothetical protein
MHRGVFNVPRQLRAAEVGQADLDTTPQPDGRHIASEAFRDCLPAAVGATDAHSAG